jgi:mono/diheme cytochrome c family protein
MKYKANNVLIKTFFFVCIIACGIFFYQKSDSAQEPAALAATEGFKYYKKNIAPIMEKNCSAKDENGNYICHGKKEIDVEKKEAEYKKYHDAPYAQSKYCGTCHQSAKKGFSFALNYSDKIATPGQYMLSYQEAKKRAIHSKIPFAKILRMPLSAQAGGFGLYHKGGEVFTSVSEPEYKKLAEWVRLENEALKDMVLQSRAEQFFGKNVLPVYVRNGCLSPSCHTFNHSSFAPDSGMETDDLYAKIEDRFSPEQVRFNRMMSKGLIQSVVYLTGDVEQSRLLLKNIPIEKGGILQRGGNNQFFSGPEDPDYQIIKKWLLMEREEAVSKLKIDGKKVDPDMVGKVQGLVFVRTSIKNHRKYLDIGKYMPGGDLYLLKLKDGETLENTTSKPINLTAPFHTGADADIREPDVRYDGRAIIFSMRIGEDDNLNVYEILLDENLDYVEKSFRRLTYGPKDVNGIKVHYTDPTYVPNPEDKNALSGGYNLDKADIVFVSNLSGGVIQSTERGIVGEADGGNFDTIIDFDRPEIDDTFIGKRIYIVDGTNKGEWRKIKSFKNRLFNYEKRSYIKVDRPFTEPVDNSCIYVIERDKETQPGFLPSYSMYGMKYPEKSDEENTYNETISRITFGIAQELDLSVRSTGEVFFSGQRSFTDKYDRPIFHMTNCRRHLDTRFSFPTHQGNRSQVLVYADHHEMPNGIDINVGMDADNLWEGGNLSVSDHQFGPGLEARNPHDFVTGFFDEDGIPITDNPKIDNTRFNFKNGKEPSHTRFMFKKIALFPSRGQNAVSRTGFSPGGIFKDSIPLPNGDILVAHSPKPINHLDPNANPDFDLYILKPDPSFHPPGGKGQPRVKKIKIKAISEIGASEVQAYPIYIRMKSKLNAARRAKRDHLIRPKGMPDDDYRPAKYLERNYLLIDAVMNDPSPVGKNVAYKTDPVTGEALKPIDEVKYVRMVEVLPVLPSLAKHLDINKIKNSDPESTSISNGIHLQKRIVCEKKLESDGSIFIKVPSKIPMVMQSLNADKMALRQSARLYFFAPNETFTISPSPSETFQTCGMCMGAMSGNPKRLFGPINTFTGQGKVKAIAKAKGNPPAYGIDVKDRITIDFKRDIQPILNKNCVACHQGNNAPKGLSLIDAKTYYYNEAYENLMQLEEPESAWYSHKKYIDERSGLAINSYLIEKIYGRELKAPQKLNGDAPHPSKKLIKKHKVNASSLTDDEKMMLVRWIDMGAAFLGAD